MKPSIEWLTKINNKFRNEHVDPKVRPFKALEEFSKEFGQTISLPSDTANFIFNWFYQNTKEGVHNIGPIYRGAYYFDACIWPVYIPNMHGKVEVNAFDCLTTMKDQFKNEIQKDNQECWNYTLLWVDCLDYAYGYDDLLEDKTINPLALKLMKSGNKELNATVSLVLNDHLESKAIETARMVVEMYLKAIIVKNSGCDEKKIKKISHDLSAAADEAYTSSQNEEIKLITPKYSFFPSIHSRYDGVEYNIQSLWKGYSLAQATATIFTRMNTDRDTRGQILKKT